jgi:uncharacterized protein (TIGR02246 family)
MEGWMKLKIFLLIVVLSMGFSLISCQGTQEEAEKVEQETPVPVMDITQVRQAIEEANIKFGDAVRMADAAALANLYTEDAKLLPPNSEMIKGKEGIEAFWGGGLEMGIKGAVLTTVDVLGMGDLVCEIGTYDLTIQPEGQEEMKDNGKYLVIWKKAADGTWKLHADIWNTSLPAQ